MEQTEFTKSIARLKISPKRKTISLFMGAYSSIFKGRGIEINDLREYVAGDNVRDIDWNATAKTQKVFVREFKESRELNILFVVDASSSMSVSLGNTEQKRNAIIDFLTLVSLAAVQNNDQFGLILYNKNVQRAVRFGKGRIHAREIVNETAKSLEKNFFQGTGHDELKKILLNGIKKKTVCFLISDAIDFTPEAVKTFRTLNKKHELTIVHIKSEPQLISTEIPLIFEDSETGEEFEFIPQKEQDLTEQNSVEIRKDLQKMGISYCLIESEKPILSQVVSYFLSTRG